MGTVGCFCGVKRPGRNANHSPPFSVEVKDVWSIAPVLHYVFTAWCLVKQRENFHFTNASYMCILFLRLGLSTLITTGEEYNHETPHL